MLAAKVSGSFGELVGKNIESLRQLEN